MVSTCAAGSSSFRRAAGRVRLPVCRAVNEHARAGARERSGDGVSEVRGRARDQYRASGEVKHG